MDQTSSKQEDRYWCKSEPKVLVEKALERREKFFERFDRSGLTQRIERNWRYYHGLYQSTGGYSGQNNLDVKPGGKLGERLIMNVNHFRSLLHLLATYITQNRPAWDCRAINSDLESLEQTELGNDLLDFEMEQGCEEIASDVAEEALVMTCAFVKSCWDDESGSEVTADPITGQIYYSGKIKHEKLSLFDVSYDSTAKDWNHVKWVLCKSQELVWDLVELYPELREEILGARKNSSDKDSDRKSWSVHPNEENADLIDVFYFYHLPTESIPYGRETRFVSDKAILRDGSLGYDRLPVIPYYPDKFLLTNFNYSTGFDLQGIQEVLNTAYSTLITTLNTLGLKKIWAKSGEPINLANLEPGIDLMQTETKPEQVDLMGGLKEIFDIIGLFRQDEEYLSGVNSVARGQPEASLRSHAALALIDAKTMQYASKSIANFYRFLGQWGSLILSIYKKYANHPRTISVVGKAQKLKTRSFTGENLSQVDRVVVESANPLQRTLAGRYEMAMALLQNNQLNAEEFLTVAKTGQLKPLTETIDAQLTKVHMENELLRQGDNTLTPAITDNHVFHIQKHSSLIDNPNMDPAVYSAVMAHNNLHLQQLVSPQGQPYQVVLGYQAPFMPGTPGAGPGTPAGGGEKVQTEAGPQKGDMEPAKSGPPPTV